MCNKRLSIIIPFYNVEQYIAQCLDSVYKQDISEEDYEVICVDDCSPDNSLSIVERYAQVHSNLVIVRNKINRKLGGARNAGMEVATGNYIWFIDSDDFIEKNCISKLLSIAEKEDLDVLHFNYSDYPNVDNPDRRPEDSLIMNGPDFFFSANFVWYYDLVTAWRKLHKRKFLIENKIMFAEHIMFEDNDYAIEVFAKSRRVKHIYDVVYFYRNNPDSITRIKYNKVHIYYWLDLAYRLVNIKKIFLHNQLDKRFCDLISTFVRYILGNLINVYRNLEDNEKKEVGLYLRKNINKTLIPYMSWIIYIKIRLGSL